MSRTGIRRSVALRLLWAAVVALAVVACSFQVVVGSGELTERSEDFDTLRGVTAGAIFDVEVVVGEPASVTLRADTNVIDEVSTEVRDGVLHLQLREGIQLRNATLEARVTLPEVEVLDASGAASIEVLDAVITPVLEVVTSGASDVVVRGLDTDHLEVAASGSSTVELTGAAQRAELVASGSSELALTALAAHQVDAQLSGAASGELEVVEGGEAAASGSSSLTYHGAGDLTASVSGSASVGRR